MRRKSWLIGALCALAMLSGCVERRFVVQSMPPGALVLRDGKPLGSTPVDDSFVYYGKYRFTLIKDGYETQDVIQDVPAPWYEIPPLDFVVENLIPFKFRDVRRFTYELQPERKMRSDEVWQRG